MNRGALPVAALALVLVGTVACTGGADRSSGPTGIDPATTRPIVSSPTPPRTPRIARPVPAGCPTIRHTYHPAIVDYADFVKWNDREFVTGAHSHETTADLGRAVGKVNCSLSDMALGPHDSLGPIRNGNAASLPVGTTLFASRSRPRCVLITKSDAHTLTAWTDLRCPSKGH